MRKPNVINDGFKKVHNFMNFLIISCVILVLTIVFLSFFIFRQNHTIELMRGKIKNDSISINSYKNLIPK